MGRHLSVTYGRPQLFRARRPGFQMMPIILKNLSAGTKRR